MAYTAEIKQAAKVLYLKAWTPKCIANELGLNNERIVYYWADKHGWRDMLREFTVDEAISSKIQAILEIPEPSKANLDLLDRLIKHHTILKKQRAQEKTAQAADASTSSERRPDNKRSNKRTNNKQSQKKEKARTVDDLTPEDFDVWVESLFEYQKLMRAVKNDPSMPRTRNVLKSRQIGFTFGCAGEAFEDAVLTGENQIFISATKSQAEVFRSYIIHIAQTFFDITLKGNPIKLPNGAELHFLATSANSAQSRAGNVYVDEYFWIRDFKKVSDVVSACATQKRFRKTYFSTPSSKNHPAYPFWTGDMWRGGKSTRKNIEFPSFDKLKDGGRVCPDKQWRYVIDVHDAVKMGCHLIDPDELEEEFSPDAFRNLYKCEFVDDAKSVFKFTDVEKLMVDPGIWQDFNAHENFPFARREVWLGYDPSRTRDNACLVVMAPPMKAGEPFRLLEKHYWKGLNFQYQANEIKKVMERYNATYLGIDTTGIGAGVWDLLCAEYPREAVAIHYSNESKTRLVMKMIDVVESKRLQFDEEQKDIASAFMAIKRASTNGGGNMTFRADRSELVGHADVFWAISHALINEPLDHSNKRKSTWKTAA